jgi:hypothetical protein
MNVPVEIILQKVGKWIEYADKDLALARHTLKNGESLLTLRGTPIQDASVAGLADRGR